MSKSLKQEFGPLMPKMKAHDAGKYSTQKMGDVITRVPVQKAPMHSSMKPR